MAIMAWRVEILNETVVAEIAALPADMQARFLQLAERIDSAGLESLIAPVLAVGRVIVAHLGNGASLCAQRDGKSVAIDDGLHRARRAHPWGRDAVGPIRASCSIS